MVLGPPLLNIPAGSFHHPDVSSHTAGLMDMVPEVKFLWTRAEEAPSEHRHDTVPDGGGVLLWS